MPQRGSRVRGARQGHWDAVAAEGKEQPGLRHELCILTATRQGPPFPLPLPFQPQGSYTQWARGAAGGPRDLCGHCVCPPSRLQSGQALGVEWLDWAGLPHA